MESYYFSVMDILLSFLSSGITSIVAHKTTPFPVKAGWHSFGCIQQFLCLQFLDEMVSCFIFLGIGVLWTSLCTYWKSHSQLFWLFTWGFQVITDEICCFRPCGWIEHHGKWLCLLKEPIDFWWLKPTKSYLLKISIGPNHVKWGSGL